MPIFKLFVQENTFLEVFNPSFQISFPERMQVHICSSIWQCCFPRPILEWWVLGTNWYLYTFQNFPLLLALFMSTSSFFFFWSVWSIFFFKNNFIYLFIFGCAGSSLCVGFLSSCREQGLLFSCRVRGSHCLGFSCCGAWVLGVEASVVAAHGLDSCSSQALAQFQ